MNQDTLVTVVMATFNEPSPQIGSAIRSIIAQTYAHWELLILDDSTNPETIRTIDTFASDTRITVLRPPQRLGFVKSLNKGLRQAQGAYIARMDGDDISLPDRLAKQVGHLDSHPEIAVLGSAMNIIDESESVTSCRRYPQTRAGVMRMTMFRNPLAHPTAMFRKSLIKAGFFYNDQLKKAEDLDLWLRLIKNGYTICSLPHVLLHYRVVGDLSDKRKRDNWAYNLRVRLKNFDIRNPLFSLISVCIAVLYLVMPESIVRILYRKENIRL